MSTNLQPTTKRKRSCLTEDDVGTHSDMHFLTLKKNFDVSLQHKEALQSKCENQQIQIKKLQDENSGLRVQLEKEGV